MALINFLNKYQRTYLIQVEGIDGKTYTIGDASGKNPALSLEFLVNRDIMASSQTGVFRIKNLDAKTRNAIYKDVYDYTRWPRLKVQAGYTGTPLSTIFDGVLLLCSSQRKGGATDFVTEIEGRDYSLFLSRTSFVSKTIANPVGVNTSQIIDELFFNMDQKASQFGITLNKGIISPNYPNNPNSFSVSLHGWTWELMQTYTDKTCFIDNGSLHCLLNNETITGDVNLISSETGLLGTPKKYATYLYVDSIFEPNLKPAQSVFLDTSGVDGLSRLASLYNGTYKVTGIQHRGIISGSENGECITTAILQLTADQRVAPFNGALASPNLVYNI